MQERALEAGEGKVAVLPRASGRAQPCLYLDSSPYPSETASDVGTERDYIYVALSL